ncbi:MAG: hypothetical protein VX930_02460 [Pseudomonadota bacterium]|nr:hypothetical protein [Pseudomonadota bacterium]
MPYGISYSDGPQLSDKSAFAADKKKKKNKNKRSGQTQGSGGKLANLSGQRVAAGRDRLRKQVARGGDLDPPAIFVRLPRIVGRVLFIAIEVLGNLFRGCGYPT